jgi:NAD(P)-dependent dehydrogenase (short-subunit alcohol dehydrogenase family)
MTSLAHDTKSLERDLTERTVLVTGGTDGIGKAIATRLAARGATVAIVGRTASKGEQAAQAIADAAENESVTFWQADFSEMTDVRRFASAFRETYDRLDALVHSAGVIHSTRIVTDEGLEASFAINYLSRFLLTHLLLDRLKASAPARIVNVAYAGGDSVDALDFDDLQGAEGFSGMQALSQAQVANDLFGLELAERLEGTGVGIAVANPGLVDTDIRRKRAPWYMPLVDYLLWFARRSPAEVAEDLAPLAADVAPAALNGQFFGPDGEPIEVPDEQQDPPTRKRLWRVSSDLVGLRDEDGPDRSRKRAATAAKE